MKKQIVLASLLLAAGIATASESSVSLSYRYDRADADTTSTGYEFDVGTHLTKNILVDVRAEQQNSSQGNTLQNRLEGGLRLQHDLGPVGVYARGAFGNKMKTGADNLYYSVEPGVVLALSATDAIDVGYRFRSATLDHKADTTRTARVSYTHALNKTVSVSLDVDRVQGDAAETSAIVGVSVGF